VRLQIQTPTTTGFLDRTRIDVPHALTEDEGGTMLIKRIGFDVMHAKFGSIGVALVMAGP
jgi:hypothetical protein